MAFVIRALGTAHSICMVGERAALNRSRFSPCGRWRDHGVVSRVRDPQSIWPFKTGVTSRKCELQHITSFPLFFKVEARMEVDTITSEAFR